MPPCQYRSPTSRPRAPSVFQGHIDLRPKGPGLVPLVPSASGPGANTHLSASDWRLPYQLGLALTTFLLKIILPQFAVRDRPERNSPRKSKKVGDFPARKPGEPSVTSVKRYIEFHLLEPWMIT